MSCCDGTIQCQRDADMPPRIYTPKGSYSFADLTPTMRVWGASSSAASPILTIGIIQTVNGSAWSHADESLSVIIKLADLALLPDDEALYYDVTLTGVDGTIYPFDGGVFELYPDGSEGSCSSNGCTISVCLDGLTVPVIIQSGGLGVAASIELAALNQAVADAQAAEELAEQYRDEAQAATINKADLNGSNILGANQAAFRGAIGAVSSAALAAGTGGALVGYTASITGAVLRTQAAKNRDFVSVKEFGAVGDGVADDRVALQTAIDAGVSLYWPEGTYRVTHRPDPDHWCLKVPSNSNWLMAPGAKIKGANGLVSWKRIVVMISVTNINIIGTLDIDANVQNVGTTNEHMHGLFMFDCTNSYIERVKSINARGDNVFIGGTDNTRGSYGNVIGSVYARTAGRKSFVGHTWDGNCIGVVDADNTLGGWTGSALAGNGGAIDIEPDNVSGAVRNENWIGKIISRGCGDDFTSGTSATQADSYHLNVDDYDLEVTPLSGVPAWLQYGMTLNVKRLRIAGITDVCADSNLQYAARLNVGELRLEGGRIGYMLLAARVGADVPRLRADTVYVENNGSDYAEGIENRNGEVWIDKVIGRTPLGTPLANRSTGAGLKAIMRVTSADFLNCGHTGRASSVISVSGAVGDTVTVFPDIRQVDTRGSKANRVFDVASGSSDGIVIGSVFKESATTLIAYAGTDTYYRTPSGSYVSTGTPEAKITAPIGTNAGRTDGGAATSFYVKESGTGNTGWVAK